MVETATNTAPLQASSFTPIRTNEVKVRDFLKGTQVF